MGVKQRAVALGLEASVAAPWPLIARERELNGLVASLLAGQGGYVVGDAGVGKTRLATEAVRRAGEEGLTPVWVAATRAAASVPLSPFLDILPSDLRLAGADRLQLFRAVTDELADARPAVVVDDAHLLAEPGAALLLHLALNEVPVVAVVRDSTDVPDAVAALWKDGHVPRLEVGPLDASAVGELLAAVLQGPVEHTTVTRLHEATGGNPLFLRELVLAGVRAGALMLSDGLWRIVAPLPVGRSLRELVRRRIDHLDPDVRTALELLAVAEEWPLAALDGQQRRAVEALENDELVRIDRDGRRAVVRPAHPILGETIRADLGAVATHAALRQLISMQHLMGERRRDDRLRLAVWQLEVGGQVEPEILVDAARRALQLMHPDLAARLAASARTQGAGIEATVLLAAAEIEQNHFDVAERELASCETEALAGTGAAEYAIQRSYALGIGLGRIDDALELLGKARCQTARAERVSIDAMRAALLAAATRMNEAAQLADDVATAPDAGPAALMTVTAPAAIASNGAGLVDQAIARCLSSMPLVEEHGGEFPRERVFVLGPLVTALMLAGRYAEVEAVIRPQYDAAVASHDEATRGGAAGVLGTVALEAGRPGEARPWLQEALAPLASSDPFGLVSPTLARLALAEALVGSAPAARRALDRAVEAVRGQLRWDMRPLSQAQVWTLVAHGDVAGAQAEALRQADCVPESAVHRALLTYDAVRLGETDPAVVQSVIELTDGFEGARFAAINAHVRGIAAGNPDAVWASVEQLAQHDSLLSAADAAATTALWFEAAGEKRRAAAARRRALQLVEEAAAAPTPAVAALTPTPLTRREQQVVALASEGRSDREIAEALQLSVRTVESHLHRAYAKLGVTGRAALRTLGR